VAGVCLTRRHVPLGDTGPPAKALYLNKKALSFLGSLDRLLHEGSKPE
jgi:hypothetical protein